MKRRDRRMMENEGKGMEGNDEGKRQGMMGWMEESM